METVLTEAKSEDVRNGKTEQIEVGRRVHGAVGGDDHTGGHVADDPGEQNHRVDDGQQDRLAETAVPPAQVRPDVVRLVQTTTAVVGGVRTVVDGHIRGGRIIFVVRKSAFHVSDSTANNSTACSYHK